MVADLADGCEVGIHTHNDSECAVANSLAAVEAGARLVQGCVNGYGERCGNANLASILPALQLKMGFEVVSEEQLASLTPTSHYLDELCNMTPNPDRAYVGVDPSAWSSVAEPVLLCVSLCWRFAAIAVISARSPSQIAGRTSTFFSAP